jgi:hypothetical protein
LATVNVSGENVKGSGTKFVVTRRSTLTLLLLALIAAGCGSATRSAPAPATSTEATWTSPAEPSPPGSGGRWEPSDEQQLLRSFRSPR